MVGGFALALIALVLIGVFAWNQYDNNKKFASDEPYNEKIADGAWILHNQDRERVALKSQQNKIDLNLKEVINVKDFIGKAEATGTDSAIAKPFDVLGYKWVVTLSSGTNFEFGGVAKDTPEGKVLPVVRVRNTDGAYVAFAPRSMKQESRITKNNDKTPNSEFIIHDSVVPKVEGNIISWEISDGITARYTMMEDRVKADYIISEKSKLQNSKLDFDLQYSGGELVLGQIGDIRLLKEPGAEGENLGGKENLQFRIPVPIITDNTNDNFEGSYSLSENENGKKLSIIIPAEELSKASFPLTVDPSLIDGGQSGALDWGNGRNILRDAWGNLIILKDSSNAYDGVWYKNYNSTSWVDTGLDLDFVADSDRALNIAADIDSNGDIHTVWYYDGVIDSLEATYYQRLNVVRNSNNEITNIVISDTEKLDAMYAVQQSRPALLIANKGAGQGKEKVVVTYAASNSPTARNEMRVWQKDVYNVGYEDMILADSNLVGYWRLNELGDRGTGGLDRAVDFSTNKYHGALANSPLMGASPAAILETVKTRRLHLTEVLNT